MKDVLRWRLKTTGDGEGVLDDDGEDEPDALRRSCSGGVGCMSFGTESGWLGG